MSKTIEAFYIHGPETAIYPQTAASPRAYGEVFIGNSESKVEGTVDLNHEDGIIIFDFGNYCEIWPTGSGIDNILQSMKNMAHKIGKSKVVFNQVLGKPAQTRENPLQGTFNSSDREKFVNNHMKAYMDQQWMNAMFNGDRR